MCLAQFEVGLEFLVPDLFAKAHPDQQLHIKAAYVRANSTKQVCCVYIITYHIQLD